MERRALTNSEHKPHRCNFKECSFASARESSLKNHLLKNLVKNELFSAKLSDKSIQNSRPMESATLKSTSIIAKHSCKICEFKTRKLKKYNAHVQSHREQGHLFCLICDFVTLKQKRFEKHLKTHVTNTGCEYSSKRKNVTPAIPGTNQGGSYNSNSSVTEETPTIFTKSETFKTMTQLAESATEKELPAHKKLKLKHHFNFTTHSDPELQQMSKERTQIQPNLQLEPLSTKMYLNHNPNTKTNLSNLAAIKTEKEITVQLTDDMSTINAKHSLKINDCSHSVPQVKVEQCKRYSCHLCGFGTKGKRKYKDHVELHQQAGHLFCSLCDFVSLNEKLFKKHMRAHKNNLRGNISNLRLTNEYTSLQLDVLPVSSNSLSLPPIDSDEIAIEKSAAEQLSGGDDKLLNMPEKQTLGGKECFCCSVCDYKTQIKQRLTDHVRTHTGDRPFSCTYSGCNYSSALKYNLTTHLVVRHSGAKPHSCKLCGEAFKTKNRLNSHVINHTGRRPHQCLYKNCEYSSTRASDLKLHIRSHTKEKPHHCYFEGCGFCCSRTHILKAHIRTHTGERPYPCNFKGCNLSFRNRCDLKNHIFTHTGAKPFRCKFNDCEFSSARANYLKVHMLRHLTQNPHVCPKCKFRSRTPLEIEQHLQTHHKLENTSNSRDLQPNAPIGESPAESVTNILRAQAQPTLITISQNNNERDSEIQDAARPCLKYVCTRCAFVSKSKKKYKSHLNSHGQKRKNSTHEVIFTNQDTFSSENSSLTQQTSLLVKKSEKLAGSLGEIITENELHKQKKIKSKHHLKNHPEFRQASNNITQIQAGFQLKPSAIQPKLNSNRRRNIKVQKPGIKREEESSAGVEIIESLSPAIAQNCVVNHDLLQSVSPVKVRPRKKFSCPICEFGTKQKRKYKEHVELHQKEGYLFCSLCEFVILNSKLFKKHLRTHENDSSDGNNNSEIQNNSCSKVPLMSQETLLDTSSSFLIYHTLPLSGQVAVDESAAAVQQPEHDSKLLKMKYKETLDEKKCFKCSVCDYKTQYKYRLTEHTRIHTGDRPFSCTYSGCSYSSAKNSNCMRHLVATHSDEKPYSCKLCREAFKTKYLLNSHVINHAGRRPHQCLYKNCEYSSTTASHLKIHIRSHTQEKPYHCYFEGCGHSCSMSWDLKSHIRTHTGERPYPCNFKGCNLSFRNLLHLKNHVFTHTGAKPFHCDFNDCKYSCIQSSYLKVHMLQHLTKNPFTCPKCKFRSRTSLEIKQHLETFHKLQNASPSRGQPDSQIRERPAEAITNILRVRAQPFSSQNNNESYSESLDVVRPSKNYICARCGFNSKSKKKYKAHLESHVEKRQFLETRGTKLTKRKRSSTQGKDNSSNQSQGKENSTSLRETKKSVASFPCNFCKKTFAKEMKLLNHLRYHTGQKMPG